MRYAVILQIMNSNNDLSNICSSHLLIVFSSSFTIMLVNIKCRNKLTTEIVVVVRHFMFFYSDAWVSVTIRMHVESLNILLPIPLIQ